MRLRDVWKYYSMTIWVYKSLRLLKYNWYEVKRGWEYNIYMILWEQWEYEWYKSMKGMIVWEAWYYDIYEG